MIYLLLLIVLIGIAAIVYCWQISSEISYIKTRSRETCLAEEIERGNITPENESFIVCKDIKIKSRYGYHLSGKFFPQAESKKVVILCHGINCTLYESYKYRDIFFELGFSVLAYDQRHHGESGGKNITYGFYEKYDLLSWIEWVKKNVGSDVLIGIHGESMGGSVALISLPLIWQDIKFCVVDSTFTDLSQILLYRIKRKNRIYNKILLSITDFILLLRTGMSVQKVSPLKCVTLNVKVPILVVHGLADRIVPPQMGLDVFENISDSSKKYIFTVINADHTEAVIKDRKGYMEALQKLLKNCQ